MKRAAKWVFGGLLVLMVLAGVLWYFGASKTPESSLDSLAFAARNGWWSIVDLYADREGMRRELGEAFALAALRYKARQACNGDDNGFSEDCYESMVREYRDAAVGQVSESTKQENETMVATILRGADGSRRVVSLGSDGTFAEAVYPEVKGVPVRLRLEPGDGGYWQVVSIASAAEIAEAFVAEVAPAKSE